MLSIAHQRPRRPSPVAAATLVLLLVVGPLVMLVEFGLLRDIPATLGCGEPEDVAAEIRYQRDAWTFVTLAEVAALGALLVALRRGAGLPNRWVDVTIAAVAIAAGAALTTVIMSSNATDAALPALAAGVPVGIATWLALRYLAGRRPTWKAFAVALALAVPLLAIAYVTALIAAFGAHVALGVLAVLVAAVFAWLFPRPSWPALVTTAGIFAVFVIPAAGLMIFTRGHGPLAC